MTRYCLALMLLILALSLGVGSRIANAQAGEAPTAAAPTADPGHAAGAAGEAAHGAAPSEEGGSIVAIKPGELIATIAVFLGLLAVLRLTAWKPILAALKTREQAIRDGIEAAAQARAQAEKTTRELEGKVAEAQRQGAQAMTQAKADAVKIAEGIKAQAETESAALKDRVLRDIEAAKQQALADINAHVAELGIAVARKILQREITVEDQARLVQESIKQYQASKN